MKFQKISRTTMISGDARGRGLPADRHRRRLLQAIATAPLLLGMPGAQEYYNSIFKMYDMSRPYDKN